MSFHFLSHSWEVTDLDDGLMVTVSQQEMEETSLGLLMDEFGELIRESGQSNLYVDFGKVRFLTSNVFDKLIALDARVRDMACRLIVCDLNPALYQSFQADGLAYKLDVRLKAAREALVH